MGPQAARPASAFILTQTHPGVAAAVRAFELSPRVGTQGPLAGARLSACFLRHNRAESAPTVYRCY